MTLAISLDIETLSTHKNAVVLSIGACTVSLDGSDESTFYMELEPQQQIDMGRHVSWRTLQWWLSRSKEAREASLSNSVRADPHVVLIALWHWMVANGSPPVYTKGPSFDAAILDSLTEDLGMEPVVRYRDHRDVRTIEEALQTMTSEGDFERFALAQRAANAGLIGHNALDDAKTQAVVVREWLMRVGHGAGSGQK